MKPDPNFDLESFQNLLSRLIFTPLIQKNNSLVADTSEFQRILLRESKSNHYSALGLETYSRSYWYKQLSTLQSSLPLVSNLLGLWDFNNVALRFLSNDSKCNRDLGDIPESFFIALQNHFKLKFKSEKKILFEQALQLDLAWHQLFKNQPKDSLERPLVPTEQTCFKLKDEYRILQDSFGLWELRFEINSNLEEERAPNAPSTSRQKYTANRSPDRWIIMKSAGHTVDWMFINPLNGLFLKLLDGKSLAKAVDDFSGQLNAEELEFAQKNIHIWIKESLEQNLWDFLL